MSVFETIIGKKKPLIEDFDALLEILQKFMIESKSMCPIRRYSLPQEALITMYSYGALVSLSEAHNVPEECYLNVLQAYLERKGFTSKEAKIESKTITQQSDDPKMQWHVEIGYNAARYWHVDNDTTAPKALARLLRTTR